MNDRIEPNTYTKRRWLRRAETAHRKLVELAEDIQQFVGDDDPLYSMASSAHCEVHQLCTELEPPQRK